jgi:hypothetical protein
LLTLTGVLLCPTAAWVWPQEAVAFTLLGAVAAAEGGALLERGRHRCPPR